MRKLIYKNFTKLTSDEKEIILRWRNSERVRLRMKNQQIILPNQHIKWLDSLNYRTDCRHYLVYVDFTPLGVLNHTNLSPTGENCSGGSYVGNEKLIGYGIPMIYYGWYDFFENLKMRSSIIYILKSNSRVYMLHKKFFYPIDIKEDTQYYYMTFDISSWEKIQNKLKTIIDISYDFDVSFDI